MTLGALPALGLWAELGVCIGLFHADLGALNTSGLFSREVAIKNGAKTVPRPATRSGELGQRRPGRQVPIQPPVNYFSSTRRDWRRYSPSQYLRQSLEDVHLGDVVVGWPCDHKSCVSTIIRVDSK